MTFGKDIDSENSLHVIGSLRKDGVGGGADAALKELGCF